VRRRPLGAPSQQCGLANIQLSCVFREVRLGSRLDAVRAIPEVHGIEPRPQDSLLRPLAVELNREAGLAQLAADRSLARDVEVADELLRQRGTAFDDLPLGEVAPEGAGDALVVDAAVAIEAAVLDGNRRAPHPRTDLFERHRL